MGLGKIALVKWNRKFNNTQLKILRNVNRKKKKKNCVFQTKSTFLKAQGIVPKVLNNVTK